MGDFLLEITVIVVLGIELWTEQIVRNGFHVGMSGCMMRFAISECQKIMVAKLNNPTANFWLTRVASWHVTLYY